MLGVSKEAALLKFAELSKAEVDQLQQEAEQVMKESRRQWQSLADRLGYTSVEQLQEEVRKKQQLKNWGLQ